MMGIVSRVFVPGIACAARDAFSRKLTSGRPRT